MEIIIIMVKIASQLELSQQFCPGLFDLRASAFECGRGDASTTCTFKKLSQLVDQLPQSTVSLIPIKQLKLTPEPTNWEKM